MLETIRTAIYKDHKTNGAQDNEETLSQKITSTLKKRISYGIIHSLKRSGLTDLTPSQEQAYGEAYHNGYMDAWNATGANKKTVHNRLSTSPNTIIEIGWQDGAVQGSADVITLTNRLI